jgi:hypothetical protein
VLWLGLLAGGLCAGCTADSLLESVAAGFSSALSHLAEAWLLRLVI